MARALLVDDDVALLESAQEGLALRGIEIVVASTWEEGLELFTVVQPDLVIADYNMPGSQQGLRLLIEMKRRRPSVRLVLISGYLDEKDLEAVRGLGLIDRALTKGTARQSVKAIREEIDQLERAASATDWIEHAQGQLDVAALTDEKLDELDALLTSRVRERDGG